MLELIYKCWDYLKANKTMAIIIGAIALLFLITLVVIIVKAVKRSKAKKKAKSEPKANAQKQAVKKVAPSPAPAVKPADKTPEEKEALRKATLERLKREREEAEREEAESLARLEAEKAQKEKEVAEEKARLEREQAQKEKEIAELNAKLEKEQKKIDEEKAKAKAKKEKPAQKKSIKKAPKKDESLYDELVEATKTLLPDFEDEDETEKTAKYSGKWSIYRVVFDGVDEEEMYFFELLASNGEKLLSSEEYTSYAGALRGIETHKTNIEKGNFKITLSKKGDYIFKLLSGKNMLLCMGENYPTKARCESAIESTKRFAKTAVLDENVHDHLVKVPKEDENEKVEVAPDSAIGKWLISSAKGANGEEVFFFELFANNGEKLLASEEYTTYVGAVNGIGTHKANIEKGNFKISLTKRGDYIYKLLNGNGQLLCLGEHYKTKRLCQNAVESVKRFAKVSPVLAESAITK